MNELPERILRLDDGDGTLLAILVIDSTCRGPAFGGVRRVRYPTPGAAEADARRLARAMTLKCALAGLDAGGAKTVVLDRPGLDLRTVYLRLGALIDSLGGTYVCGPDVGTGERELAWLREATRHVNPPQNDASTSTARGVLAGLHATLLVATGDAGLDRRQVLVQGLGGVGSRLAAALAAAGARVLGLEVDAEARARAEALGVSWPSCEEAWPEVPCDLFAPCALGHVLSPSLAPRLRARAVCGSANNVLADDDVGAQLHGRGVLVAPDILVTAGAVIEGVVTTLEGESPQSRARIATLIDAIGPRCEALLHESVASRVPPARLAESAARERIGGR